MSDYFKSAINFDKCIDRPMILDYVAVAHTKYLGGGDVTICVAQCVALTDIVENCFDYIIIIGRDEITMYTPR